MSKEDRDYWKSPEWQKQHEHHEQPAGSKLSDKEWVKLIKRAKHNKK